MRVSGLTAAAVTYVRLRQLYYQCSAITRARAKNRAIETPQRARSWPKARRAAAMRPCVLAAVYGALVVTTLTWDAARRQPEAAGAQRNEPSPPVAPSLALPPALVAPSPPALVDASWAPAPAAPAASQNAARPHGATVGMAINCACANLTARGEFLEPGEVTQIASELLRVAAWLEAGHTLPKRAAASDNDGRQP